MTARTQKNLKDQAVGSSGWGFLDQGIGFIIQFIIGIVLARLLPPSDFGLIGLGMIVVGFGQIFVNLGLGPSLIQKRDITERHIRVVFTISLLAGIGLAGIVFAGAPLTAIILDNENVIPIVKVLSVIFVIGGLQIPSQALLKKQLDFKHIFYVSLIDSISYGAFTIILALKGWGVWSLVIGTILRRTMSFVGSYWYVRHSLKLLFSKKELLDLAHFGSGETLSSIFNYFARQGDYFMVGRILGAEALGLYTKSYALMVQPTHRFVSVLSNVLFPTTSIIQSDTDRLRKIFLQTMRVIAFVTIPLCVLLIILAPEIIIGLYGENWAGAIVPLQILGAFGMFRALYNTAAVFLKAKGWVYSIFSAQVIYGISVLLSVWLGATYFELPGAAWATGISILIMWYLMVELNCRAIVIRRFDVIKTLLPGIVISTAFSIPLIGIKYLIHGLGLHILIQLLILAGCSIILIILTVWLTPQNLLQFVPVYLLRSIKGFLPQKCRPSCENLILYLK